MSTPAVTSTSSGSTSTLSSYNVQINASAALKIANIGENNYPSVCSGPIYGFNDRENSTINMSHIINFPGQYSNNSNDEFFNMKQSNVKFQNDFLLKLRENKNGVNLLGWFVCSTGGKYISQNVIESLIQFQEDNFKENKDETPALFLVYDPSKSLDGLLSLRVLKLSTSFIKTWKSDNKFVAKNLIENRLSYKNIFEEVPLSIKNNHLVNLKIQEIDSEFVDGENLELTSNNLNSITLTTEQLFDSMDHFNHNLGNMNYYQRNLNREIAKITKWESKVKQDNEEKLKADTSATLENADWKKEFKLPAPSSKYENLIISGLINNYCNNLETTDAVEYAKSVGIKTSLNL